MKVGLVNQVSFRATEDVKPTIVGAGVKFIKWYSTSSR